jgi:GrpB-like predicted nucleotidyltransferase (UPF0157 family)
MEARLEIEAGPPVRVVCPDPAWPELFEREQEALAAAVGGLATGGIHHVGGTAVAGVDSEPVVDILLGTEDLAAARACGEELAALGYAEEAAPQRVLWLRRPGPGRQAYHLRVAPAGSRYFRRELAFRELLRSHRQVAIGYAWMKRDLARRFRDDRRRYTDTKNELIASVLVAARLAD